ncbi:hypothetical protein DFS34DRAFT_222150 [Phlyctochytrium arcticum]|nr:hypothetical protein DFS34DRAFT_222150 [Phlyctochytrium arcticum]
MTHMDLAGGLPLPNCPYRSSKLRTGEEAIDGFTVYNPTATFTFLLIGLACLCLGIVTRTTYRSAKVFNRVISDRTLNNDWWALFFALIGASAILESIRYGMDLPNIGFHPYPHPLHFRLDTQGEKFDTCLLLAAALLRTFACFCASAALVRHAVNGSPDDMIPQSNAESYRTITIPNSVDLAQAGGRGVQSPGVDNSRFITPPETPNSARASRCTPHSTQPVSRAGAPYPDSEDEGAPLLGHSRRVFRALAESSGRWYRVSSGHQWVLVSGVLATTRVLLLLYSLITQEVMSHTDRYVQSLHGNEELFVTSRPYSWPFMLISVLTQVAQIVPILILSAVVVTRPRQRASTGTSNTRPVESVTLNTPSILARSFAFAGALCGPMLFLEPGSISRIALAAVTRDPTDISDPQHRICAVPPWWWGETEPIFSTVVRASLRGWASLIDLSQWIGCLGILLFFFFMRAEYRRYKEEWIWISVTQLQAIFDFRRP